MAFNSNSGKQNFSATAAQTDFDFNFKIYEDTDVKVYLTPVGNEPDDTADILTLASEYTVSVDGDAGGTVTLLSGATLNDVIVIKRELPVTRETSYVTQGDLLATTINIDQNYQTYLIIDSVVDLAAALRLPDTAVGVATQLPAVAALAYLRWNAAGDAIENDTTIPDSLIAAVAAAAAAAASATEAELSEWEAEAEALTSLSYAIEPEDTEVNLVTSDGDGTFTYTPQTGVYSALHSAAKADASIPYTQTPQLDGNTTGSASSDLIVTILNYSATATYTISVEAGSYVRSGDEITWTLPSFTGVDDSHNLLAQAQEAGKTISNAAIHTVSVTSVPVADQTILYENATINSTTFPTLTNVDVSGNTILATADTASATSSVVSQDGGDTDFVNATPTVDNTAVNYTVDSATTTSATVSNEVLTDGDTILLNDGAVTTLEEYDTTSKVTDNGVDGSLNSSTTDAVPTMTSATTPSGLVFATSEFNTTLAKWKAFDDSSAINNIWTSASGTIPNKIGYKFTAAKIVNKVIIKNAGDVSHNGADATPKNFTIEASNNTTTGLDGDWDILDTVINSPATLSLVHTHTFINPFEYISYRLNITDNNGDALLVELDEISFVEATNATYTIDITAASLASAPTTVAKDTASVSTSIVDTGAGDSFLVRTIQSHTGSIATTPTTITDVFDTDVRSGRDIKHYAQLKYSGDEVTRISTVVQKLS